jgi:hypothetical protein
MKYWLIRLSAAFFVMGSFGIGFLLGAEYGLWVGFVAFIASMALGIYLHKTADKIRNNAIENNT